MRQDHKKSNRQLGFSLAEILVVIAVVGIVGVIITEIFVSSIRGSNKAAITANLKRNGQTAMESMDKNIRNAKAVICPPADTGTVNSDSIVIQTQTDTYIRYRFTPPTPSTNPTANGKIEVDYPQPTQAELANVASTNCSFATVTNLSSLTETNTRSGVSVTLDAGKNLISRNVREGYVDLIKIEYKVSPGVSSPTAYAGQIDPEKFQTTIELRR